MRTLKFFFGLLVVTGCSFNDYSESLILEKGSIKNLTGSWLMFERGYSPGYGYIVEPVPADPPKIITFGKGGSLHSNVQGYNLYRRYRIEKDQADDVLVLATSPGTFDDPAYSARFTIKFEDGAMFLYRRWCFEGCHEAFRKMLGHHDQNP